MIDVFLSYSQDDRECAKIIAEALIEEGYSVWWDAIVKVGEAYDEVIEEQLRKARSVVVLWSKSSTKSKWVRAEATLAERNSKLLPVEIEPCERPLRFELVLTASLVDWDGDPSSEHWRMFLADLTTTINRNNDLEEVVIESNRAETSESVFVEQPDEEKEWHAIRDTNDSQRLRQFLDRFPNSEYRAQAAERLHRLLSHQDDRQLTRAQSGKQGLDVPVSSNVDEDVPTFLLPVPFIAALILTVSAVLGVIILYTANYLNVGWFNWVPEKGDELLNEGTKEIGFFSAINWSLSALMIIPLAWTFMYLSLNALSQFINSLFGASEKQTESPTEANRKSLAIVTFLKHLSWFRNGVFVIVLMASSGLALSYCQQLFNYIDEDQSRTARLNIVDPKDPYLDNSRLERDWAIAPYLTSERGESVSQIALRKFIRFDYFIYGGLGMGSFFAFAMIFVGWIAALHPANLKNYGLNPSLIGSVAGLPKSRQAIQKALSLALMVGIFGGVVCYLMLLQNLYLQSPSANLWKFLFLVSGQADSSSSLLQQISLFTGFVLAPNTPADARETATIWIFGYSIVTFFVLFFFVFWQRIQLAHNYPNLETEAEHDGSRNVVRNLRKSMVKNWPLEHFSFRRTLMCLIGILVSMAFFRIGVLLVPAIVAYTGFWLYLKSYLNAEAD